MISQLSSVTQNTPDCLHSNFLEPEATEIPKAMSAATSIDGRKKIHRRFEGKFAKRDDMVNKTLVRSLKRYYTGQFLKLHKKVLHLQDPEVHHVFETIDQVSLFNFQNLTL